MAPTILATATTGDTEATYRYGIPSLSTSASTVYHPALSTSTSTVSTCSSATHPLHKERRVTMDPSVTDRVSKQDYGDAASITKTPSDTSSDVDVELGGTQSTELPRLVLRNRPFHQSSNKVHIQHNQGFGIYHLLKQDWFHVFLRWPTSRSLMTLAVLWTGAILLFAGLYVWYDRLDTGISCGLGLVGEPMTWAAAFAFSLETCTTVGYGLPHGINSYFEQGCSSLQIIIYFQMAWSMIFNAFLITFLYTRIGRSETRATQVIHSNKALISQVDGQVRLQVRLFDADAKHPVVEAHVRFYAVMKQRPVPRPLRLLQPDDDLGAMLFLSFPSVVNHHIDLYSLLHPPTSTLAMNPQGLVLRQVDGETAGRDDVICPTCGESYGTLERWKNHVKYQQIVESKDDYPVEGTHLSLSLKEIEEQSGLKATDNLQELKEYFERNVSEVICVVEGIDPMMSGTFQALQSYRFEDIVWDTHAQFAPCLTVKEKKNNRIFEVDLDRYHDIVQDEEAVAAALAEKEEALKQQPKRPTHRRVKTVSRRQSDQLFSEDSMDSITSQPLSCRSLFKSPSLPL